MIKQTTLLLAVFLGIAASAGAQTISTVNPNSAPQGTTALTVTFTLSGMVPPTEVLPASVAIGTIDGTFVARPGASTVTAVFDIPFGESTGTKDAVVSFPSPGGTVVFSLDDGFSVTAGADTLPTITRQPQSKTVYQGLPASFSVTVSGSPPFEYQWKKDAMNLSGGTNSSYGIAAVTPQDEGGHRCLVVNAFGSVTSSVATLAVNTNTLVDLDSYVVVDTGQDECYDTHTVITAPAPGDPYYGQDAMYVGNPPSYTLSPDGMTVYDNHTGLTWPQSPDTDGDGDIDPNDKLTWAELQAYPATLNAATFGGFSDWRLPTIKELYSLIDFRGTDPNPEGTSTAGLIPFIDTNFFAFVYGDTSAGERIIDQQYASDTLYVADSNTLFGVNFADGRIKGYGLVLGGGDKTFLVLCCRGNTIYGENEFVDNGDGTVTDHAAGRMWQQADSVDGMNWEDALAYAENLELGGYRDWRLPNVKELQGLVDYTRSPDTTSSGAIDPVFACSSITNLAGAADFPFYWSSTTHLGSDGNPGRACYVVFGRGLGTLDEGATLIDIHGAGCQRSDAKTGDPADYPNAGNGPQGDVSRVFNHVRCVRGGATEPQADTDGDGLTDAYEWSYTASVTGMVATADDDGDGASNADEAVAGTLPTDDASVLQMWGIDGPDAISWTSELGKTYTLQCSTNLTADAFSTLIATGIPATTPTNIYRELPSTGDAVFYRVVVE